VRRRSGFVLIIEKTSVPRGTPRGRYSHHMSGFFFVIINKHTAGDAPLVMLLSVLRPDLCHTQAV